LKNSKINHLMNIIPLNMKYFIGAIFLTLGFLISCNDSGEDASGKTIYDVVFRENLSGTFEKWESGDKTFEYFYAYADRGRGPKYDENITLNDQNYITVQTIKGNNYSKVSVDESFSSDGTTASWTNLMGTSEGDFGGDKLYFRDSGSPAIHEILAQLLLKSESGKVSLYPEGEVELVKTFPFELSNGTATQLLMIKGLNLDPVYTWMIDDQMVCRISGNRHVVRKDLSDMRLEMKELQSGIEDGNLLEVAKKLSQKVNEVAVVNVNVFQSNGTLLKNQDVWVNAQSINSIHPTGTKKIGDNVRTIDGAGKTLMPGMFDMHTHNTKFRGILHLAGGVTSVRDLANNKQLKDLAAQFNNNEILGPRIVTYCGIIDGPGEFANQRNVVQNLKEGLAEIQDYKDLGYQQIKLYSSILPEWVKPLTEKAHDLDMKVSGHIPAYMTATQAINQGYDEIQHINMLFLNFLSDTIDTRTPLRHTMPAQHGADLDLNSKEYLEFIDLLKTKDILVDPTVAIFENMYIARVGEPSPTYSMIFDRFPLMNQRSFYTGGLPKEGEKVARYKDSFNKMLDVIADLFQKGVDIVPGTDGLPGFLYHRELELYVQAGIPAAEVLKLATIKSAEITGVAESFGSVEVGKQADLILVDGNPIDEISDIRKIEWTMKGGFLYDAEELYKSLGVKHFK
jgi:hypothetical protein